MLEKINLFKTEDVYERGFDIVFRHRRFFMALFISLLIPAVLFAIYLKKERFPDFTHDDMFVVIDWNANINLDENIMRVATIKQASASFSEFSNSFTGTQNYLLHKDMDQSVSEAKIYFKCVDSQHVETLKNKIATVFKTNWPDAIYSFSAPQTIFDKLFQQTGALLVVRISDDGARGIPDLDKSVDISRHLADILPGSEPMPPVSESHIEIRAQSDMMALYNVDYQVLYNRLQSALNAWQVGVLHTGSQYVPMVIGNAPIPINRLINEIKVVNRDNVEIPVSSLVTSSRCEDYKVLYGSTEGAFVPVNIERLPDSDMSRWMQVISEALKARFNADVSFSGSWFEARRMIKELAVVLLISLALLYFILAAQFESLRQPLILLLEIPIDISGALFMLWIFGGTINIMSMIGIVVMSGIVVNDSILKVDTINRLRRGGLPLVEAIREGGDRRLKPIIMTSITTIVALMPVLWGVGMGSEMQKPLALTVIGSMVLGTFVSLFFIPLCYYYLYKNQVSKSEISNS
jgi:multidrug efflux pump subunit AcrB